MVAVKGISEIKCDNDMWLSTVNCPRCCSSLSCDQGSGQKLDSGGRCWHQKRYFYSTAMFLYSKYSVFHVFSNSCGGRRIIVGLLSAAAQRRPP